MAGGEGLMTRRIGFLHTVPALAGAFDDLLKRESQSVGALHLADASLLQRAIDSGVDQTVQADVSAHVDHLAKSGANLVLITCSSIGETARLAAQGVSIPVVRVDEAMAQHGVDIARQAASDPARANDNRSGRIAVLATLDSTLGPTSRLVEAHASSEITVTTEVVEGAAARAGGDHAKHDQLVAAAIRRAQREADVVVLAQASMAQAINSDSDASDQIPVLTSPESGLKHALNRLGH